ncbi:MAG: 7-cyano-7-deazaguanine synthase [Acidobacteria bacterium]|nr:7-cyano-7-deazaguanine synthase [Acidobacteriota bacterium]MBP8273792.1 7-cyano-7-deazaguanine synthase [Acidobacteriota bacterium]
MPTSAVLVSGGLDSTVLLARELEGSEDQRGAQPIHVRAGLAWEDAEARAIERLLAAAPFAGRVAPVITLTVDMREVYPPSHWAVTGTPPDYNTPDNAVYLEGRNIMLIAKAAVLCARLKMHRLALGQLAGNPFPDATPQFFDAMSGALSMGLAHPLKVVAPLAAMRKADVMRLGRSLGVPLELTLSCMNPQRDDSPCGRCSKCRERDSAFNSL